MTEIVAGVKPVHVPYKGVNLAMNDVLSGRIQLVVIGIPVAAPHIMHAPDLKERLASIGTDPKTGTPEEFADYIRQEIAKWGKVVRAAGLKAV